MSSGFISETEIAEAKKLRQEEWERARQPNQPLVCPEVPYDNRSLHERLKEQKDKKDLEYEEAHKLKNLIRGLDDDEVNFLDVIDKAKMNAEKQQQIEEHRELEDFRQKVAFLQEKSLDKKILAEVSTPKPKLSSISTRPSQKSILFGLVRKRKTSSTNDDEVTEAKKPTETDSIKKPDEQQSMEEECKIQLPPPPPPPVIAEASTVPVTQSNLKINSALTCIGILPGIGKYSESSDSENSTDIDDDDAPTFDWMARKFEKSEEGKTCE